MNQAEADLTATAVSDLAKKQNRNARWSKIGGGLLVLAFLIRGAGALFGHAEIRECDDSEVKTAVSDLVDKSLVAAKLTMHITSISDLKTVARDDRAAHCSAYMHLSDDTAGTINYHIEPKQVVIDGMAK